MSTYDEDKAAEKVLVANIMNTGIPKSVKTASDSKRPSRPCRLPGCNVMHTHNGGYCCAQHCKDHRELLNHKA